MSELYLIHAIGTPHYKIGFTNVSPKTRLAALQTGSPHELALIASRPGTIAVERQLHHKLYRFHVRGEWFCFDSHEEALFHFEMRKATTTPVTKRIKSRQPKPSAEQLLANRLMKECLGHIASPRLMGLKKWEAPTHSVFYEIAETAIQEELTPNPAGVAALVQCRDEYWKRLDIHPPLFVEAIGLPIPNLYP